MKFGQDLSDHLVPEWKAQYLDYKAGKKKLKKLSKKPSVVNGSPKRLKSAKTPQLPSNDEQPSSNSNTLPSDFGLRAKSTNSNVNTTQQSKSTLSNTIDPLSHGTDKASSLHLPSPSMVPITGNPRKSLSAFTPSSLGSTISRSKKIKDKDDQVDASTPLLAHINKSQPEGYVQDLNESPILGTRDSQNRNDEEYAQDPIAFSPETNKSGTNSYLRRQSTVSKIFKRAQSFAYSPSSAASHGYNFGTPNSTGTEMEDLASYAREQFLNWVDNELEKVSIFYKEKENEVLERFLVLQDQVIQLKQQKEKSAARLRHIKTLRKQHREHQDEEEDEDEDEDENDENNSLDDASMIYLNSAASSRLKFWALLTKRKLRIFNKFDTPSLPKFEWLREDGKAEKQYYEDGYYSEDDDNEDLDSVSSEQNSSQGSSQNDSTTPAATKGTSKNDSTEQDPRFNKKDYSRKKVKEPVQSVNVPYFVARRQLKKAVYELYRSMELLKSYRLLNRTAFRKIIKKYDKATNDSMLSSYMKKIDGLHCFSSDVLENLMGKIETLFTEVFENGNRKIAVTKLRSSETEKTHYLPTFNAGILLGLSIPLLVLTCYYGLHRTVDGDLPEGKFLLQIWAGFFLINLTGCLFGINCLVWTKFKVNYKFIFEFNPRDSLDYREFTAVHAFFMFLCCLLAWFSFHDLWPSQFNGRDWPWMYLGISLGILLCPFDVFYLNSRTWLLSTFFRLLLSGFYPVEFRDFFIGDIMCSLTYSISNLSMFFCLYSTHWKGCLDGSSSTKCGSSHSRVLGFLSTVPSLWRFAQCFRRYADTGDWFPHLANMMKYTISMLYYMSLSLYRIDTVWRFRALLITFAAINSIYSAIWDILMDWSLFQFGSENFLLRDDLIFKDRWYYYAAIIIDVILRFQWIFYACFPAQIQQSALTSFGVAVAEVLRRFIWVFFRMENEHATNVHLFRASRETPLPYPVVKRRTISHRPKKLPSPEMPIKEDVESQFPSTPATFKLPPPRQPYNTSINSPQLPQQQIQQQQSTTGIFTFTPQAQAAAQASQAQSQQSPETPFPSARAELPHISPTRTNATLQSIDSNPYYNGAGSPASFASDHHLQPMGRRATVFSNLSRIITNAHIKDFQRRKTEKKDVKRAVSSAGRSPRSANSGDVTIGNDGGDEDDEDDSEHESDGDLDEEEQEIAGNIGMTQ